MASSNNPYDLESTITEGYGRNLVTFKGEVQGERAIKRHSSSVLNM